MVITITHKNLIGQKDIRDFQVSELKIERIARLYFWESAGRDGEFDKIGIKRLGKVAWYIPDFFLFDINREYNKLIERSKHFKYVICFKYGYGQDDELYFLSNDLNCEQNKILLSYVGRNIVCIYAKELNTDKLYRLTNLEGMFDEK